MCGPGYIQSLAAVSKESKKYRCKNFWDEVLSVYSQQVDKILKPMIEIS